MFSSALRRSCSTAAWNSKKQRLVMSVSSPATKSLTFVVGNTTNPRFLSTTTTSPPQGMEVSPSPPSSVNEEMAVGIQDSTRLFIRHGLGKQRLVQISESMSDDDGDDNSSIVTKWQQMMEAFLGTQVHILAGLGYTPDEQGLALYNQQLLTFVQTASPELQEELRVKGRDTWREVLITAFNLSKDDPLMTTEMNIVDARNVMHKVSQRMQEPEILESIAKKCATIVTTDNDQMVMAQKHHIVQEVLVNEVYLGGTVPLVEDCGFGTGAKGYVRMQCVMAEHQTDPLVAQYIGTAMMKILTSAGLDMSSVAA